MSRRRKRIRFVITILIFALQMKDAWLIWYGWNAYGWTNVFRILGINAACFVVVSAYFFAMDSYDWKWRRKEANQAAFQMAKLNRKLKQMYPGWIKRENGKYSLSRWYKRDECIIQQYLIRFQHLRADSLQMDVANWCYVLGWYRQLEYTNAVIEERDSYIEELEQQIEEKDSQIEEWKRMAAASSFFVSAARVEEKEEVLPLETDSIENQVRKLLEEGIKQKEIARVLNFSESKVSRIKKRFRV